MKTLFGFVISLLVFSGCRYEPKLFSDYYGFERISASEGDARRPEFQGGGQRIYYFAKTADDSLFQLRLLDSAGNRKSFSGLVYKPDKLPILSEDEKFLVYEKARRDTNTYLPYHPRLRKYYPDSLLKSAAHRAGERVDLYRFELATGREERLTANGNAHLLGFYDRHNVVYYTLVDSIFYLDAVTLEPVRRVGRYFSLSLLALNREEIDLEWSLFRSPDRKRSLLTQVVTDYQDADFNRFRYYLVQPETEKRLLVWTGGNAAYHQGGPPQVAWLDDRRFLTKAVKSKTYLEAGHKDDLRLIYNAGAVLVVHKGEIWEIDVSRGKAKKLCPVNPDFDFVLSGDRRYLFTVYRERQWEVVARLNTITRKFEELGRIEHGKIADLAPNLDGTELLFTLQDERGKGMVYLADLTKPKWKKDK
ncbi:MAG: hypothetical protein L0Z48_01570 [candidate division Zixibacteria bacterium]|nr:hypothetical protein [candidate division Zixibacteria bacterium]MCI0595212.1 hypothetical protein [candidate division Zixibacteria bacterium]